MTASCGVSIRFCHRLCDTRKVVYPLLAPVSSSGPLAKFTETRWLPTVSADKANAIMRPHSVAAGHTTWLWVPTGCGPGERPLWTRMLSFCREQDSIWPHLQSGPGREPRCWSWQGREFCLGCLMSFMDHIPRGRVPWHWLPEAEQTESRGRSSCLPLPHVNVAGRQDLCLDSLLAGSSAPHSHTLRQEASCHGDPGGVLLIPLQVQGLNKTPDMRVPASVPTLRQMEEPRDDENKEGTGS